MKYKTLIKDKVKYRIIGFRGNWSVDLIIGAQGFILDSWSLKSHANHQVKMLKKAFKKVL